MLTASWSWEESKRCCMDLIFLHQLLSFQTFNFCTEIWNRLFTLQIISWERKWRDFSSSSSKKTRVGGEGSQNRGEKARVVARAGSCQGDQNKGELSKHLYPLVCKATVNWFQQFMVHGLCLTRQYFTCNCCCYCFSRSHLCHPFCRWVSYLGKQCAWKAKIGSG